MNGNSQLPGPGAQATLVQAMLDRGVAHHQHGRLQEAADLYRRVLKAAPHHADALHLLGVVALQHGQFEVAADLIKQAIAIRPADNFYCNLGNALKEQGLRDEAIACYRQALALNAHLAQALCNLGNLLLEQGNASEAVSSCRRAIALQPALAEAHCNLGNALLRQGHLVEAIACYRQALSLQPQMTVGHSNLGDALCLVGQASEALACYRKALTIGLDTADLRARMSRAFKQQGRLDMAIDSCVQALHRDEGAAFRTAFVQTIKTAHFQAPQPEVRAYVLRALDEMWADPGDLLTPSTSLVEANPAVQLGIAHARLAWADKSERPAPLDSTLLADIVRDDLLLRLLATDTINSIALERLLTLVRGQLLDDALAIEPAGAAGQVSVDALASAKVAFHCALARQCFINEYVYACSDHELRRSEALQARLVACSVQSTVPDAMWLAARASYAPLSELPGAEMWSALPWPAALAAVFRQQVVEPGIEHGYRAAMPRLTKIDDAVSRLVRAQYEAHPYPRWVHAPRVTASMEVDTLLQLQFPGVAFQPLGTTGPMKVLVAGCGTGQHPIQVAQQFGNASVLAIDLSLASLCYARRKTEEMGLSTIDYAQADLLNLGMLERRFDLIESVGVLHHLEDPVAGWRVLLELLRPGGLMLLGLYSELGRREVAAARGRAASHGLPANAQDIRRCRQTLMDEELAPQFEQFLHSRDFYSTSACRDLLFHVQEHRFTVPQIKDILAQLRLKFIGFVVEPEDAAEYARLFPDDPAKIDLDHWHVFETGRPNTFARMYQFWVQRPQ